MRAPLGILGCLGVFFSFLLFVRRTCCELKGIPLADQTAKDANTWDQGTLCFVCGDLSPKNVFAFSQ